jgi:hypothetical protein
LQQSDTNQWYYEFSDPIEPFVAPDAPKGDVMPKTHVLVLTAVLLAGSTIAGSAEYQSLDAMGLAAGKGMKTPLQDQLGV